jgi:nitrogen regulatory protein PII
MMQLVRTRGRPYRITNRPVCQPKQIQEKPTTIETITQAARTGKIGDGKIFVDSLEQIVSSRTGEAGTGTL